MGLSRVGLVGSGLGRGVRRKQQGLPRRKERKEPRQEEETVVFVSHEEHNDVFSLLMTMHCGRTHRSHWLATGEGRSATTLRHRLREWSDEADATRGRQRPEIQGEEHGADLLAWVREGWEGEKRRAMVLDATTRFERFPSRRVGVVLQGCLIPVAWERMPATGKGE